MYNSICVSGSSFVRHILEYQLDAEAVAIRISPLLGRDLSVPANSYPEQHYRTHANVVVSVPEHFMTVITSYPLVLVIAW